jgi:hypothetical protein
VRIAAYIPCLIALTLAGCAAPRPAPSTDSSGVFHVTPVRPVAAEALVRVERSLAGEGYGLLVYDAYRPWYVTRVFWDAMPPGLPGSWPILPKARATIAAAPWT